MKLKDEFVDLVDASGVIQKTGILRTDVDRYPQFHMQIVIGVIFDKHDRILVHKRAQTKKVNPGDIDHICGGVNSGETPEKAIWREAEEEAGINPSNLTLIAGGINSYKRYRYLLVGEAEGEPGEPDRAEVEWVKFLSLEDLKAKQKSGELTFVDEFFEDMQLAVSHRRHYGKR